ncbi:MAG: alpha/beta fold hydrolase [Humibacillus sp.]
MPVVQREDGAEIWWDAIGPEGAPAVVLIMGLGYPSASWWRQVPALSERYRVIVLDNRGAGHTGDVVGAPYTVSTMAADVIAALQGAGEAQAHLVGISMGGTIAQEVALTRPELVRSLTLMATHSGIAHAVMNPAAIAMLQARASMTADEAAEASIPFNYAPTTPREHVEQDWAVRLPLACTIEGYTAQAVGASAWDSLERLPSLDLPTLVVHGELDALVPLANGELIAEVIPGAELVVVADANHVLTTDKAAEVNALLLAWLDRQP